MGVLAKHTLDVFLTRLERFDGGVLRGCGGGHHDVLVYTHHGVRDGRRGADPAEAPAGHGVGLREAAEQDGALLHPGQRREANVLDAVDQSIVDLV